MVKDSHRIIWIDIAKAIGMYLVIHNHFQNEYNNSGLKIVIASFHMPLFFILSGLTIKSIDNVMQFRNFVARRFISIMLPFYLWNVIFLTKSPKGLLLLFYGSNPSICSANGIGASWYFPCFFTSCIIVALITLIIYRFNNKYINLWIAVVILFIGSYVLSLFRPSIGFPFSLDVALLGASFIIIGMIFKQSKIYSKMTEINKPSLFCIGLLCTVISIVVALLNKPSYQNELHRPVMALAYYGIYPLFVLTGISGSFAIMVFSILLKDSLLQGGLSKIGTKTFTILMLQQLFITIVERVFSHFLLSPSPVYPLILSCIVLIICFYISIVICALYPNLVGKNILNDLSSMNSKQR